MIKHSIMLKESQKAEDVIRLDKWLWCTRFYKTRKLALEAIRSGKVRQDGDKVKPSRTVKPGDSYAIKRGPYTQEITVLGLVKSRCSAPVATTLYRESEESIRAREQLVQQLKVNNAMLPRSHGRPTKRERRKIIAFTRGSDE